jgi:hypothetical protein
MLRYWTPEPLFLGQSVAVLGNGPSLSAAGVADLDPRYVVAVNQSAELCQDAAVLFSRDSQWCQDHKALIASVRCLLKVTTKRDAAKENDMLLVRTERRESFPSVGHDVIRYGISSGHMAVSLAIAMGAKELVLYGFDGRIVGGRSHWHDRYSERRLEVYASFVKAWLGWNAAAKAVGVRIVNATPGSAVAEFDFLEMAVAA